MLMKAPILFLLCVFTSLASTIIVGDQTQDCTLCIDNVATKWCSPDFNTLDKGKCCKADESGVGCGGGPQDICSSNQDRFPMKSAYLLCPYDSYACINQEIYVFSDDDHSGKIDVGGNYIRSNSTCWYKIQRWDLSINSLTLNNFTFRDAEVEIYRDSKNGGFEFIARVDKDSDFSKTIPYGDHLSIYVVARNIAEDDTLGHINFSASRGLAGGFGTEKIVITVIASILALVLLGVAIKCCVGRTRRTHHNYSKITEESPEFQSHLNHTHYDSSEDFSKRYPKTPLRSLLSEDKAGANQF